MTRTKLTVRQLYTDNNGNRNSRGKPGQGNKRITRQRNRNFKLKKLLPRTKINQVKKNGQVIRTVNVRRKTIHSNGNKTLRF